MAACGAPPHGAADDAPERQALAVEIAELRSLHGRLQSARRDASAEIVHESRERIVATRRVIAAADARVRIAARRAPDH